MKNIYIISIFLTLSSVNSYSQIEWFWQNPTPSGSSIEDIYFLNQNTGFAAGWNGTILKTTDSGLSWFNLKSGVNYIFYSVYFINEFTGFAASADFMDHTYRGAIIKTTDGGINWVESIFNSISFNDICFINQNTGYACGVFNNNYAALYKTTNCGVNWFSFTNIPASFWLTSMQFFNEDTGYISDQQKLIKTTNGGVNWINVGENVLSGIFDIEFVNFNTGYAVGNYGGVFKTSNAGLNWTLVHYDASTHNTSSVFLNENTGYVCGKNKLSVTPGKLIKTTNGGTTWDSVNYSSNANLNDICRLGNTNEFVMGGISGELFRSTNSGMNWSPLRSNMISTNIVQIKFRDLNTGYILGFDDNMLKSTNSGINWVSTSTFTGEKLRSIEFINNGDIVIACNNCNILRSSNSGLNWSKYILGTNTTFESFQFVNQGTGYMSANGFLSPSYYGLLYKTSNSGINWNLISSNLGNYYYACYFLNENTGFLSKTTNSGLNMQLRTTNAGVTWNQITLPEYHLTNCFYFINQQTGFACGTGSNNVSLLRTSNAGINWSSINIIIPYGTHFNSVFFTNPNIGYLVGLSNHDYAKGGEILKTVDGGFTWYRYTSYPTFPSIYNEVNSVYFINENTGFIGGVKGLILKTTNGGNIAGTSISSSNLPDKTQLSQNYPNPFNPVTKIKFDLYKSSFTKVLVYDVLGKLVTTIINEELKPGSYETVWDGTWYATGVYYFSLVTGDFIETKRMVLLK